MASCPSLRLLPLIFTLIGALAFGCSSEDDDNGGGGATAGDGGAGAGGSGAGGVGGSAGGGGASVGCESTALAFIRVVDPSNDFSVTDETTEDTTDLPVTWGRYNLQLGIIADYVGQRLQYGFSNTAEDFEPSGVIYDNVLVDPDAEYTQTFESLVITEATALEDDGWIFFNNVFDDTGEPPAKRFYGGPAPNASVDPDTVFISALVSGEGGDTQGDQQLSVYSDYNCCDEPDEGHLNGTDRVQVNVYREREITAADVGETIDFGFDAKRGNINEGCD